MDTAEIGENFNMRIFVANKIILCNLGDNAMYQINVARLKNMWPNAMFDVVSDDIKLAEYFPGACAISSSTIKSWIRHRRVFDFLYRIVPDMFTKFLQRIEGNVMDTLIWLAHPRRQLAKKHYGVETNKFSKFLESLFNSDLVVVTAGGNFIDGHEEYGLCLLNVIEKAHQFGKPTVMLGQGIGDIKDSELRTKMGEILPLVDLIAIREGQTGPTILNAFGVQPDKVTISGDDAIELAYNERNAELGVGIGVNLRIADYSGVDNNHFSIVQQSLYDFATKYDVQLIPLPISLSEYDSDVRTIQKLLDGYSGQEKKDWSMELPIDVIRQTRSCRVVVTGSYHAGVFALSQGIPVVGLAKSQFYIDKFLGLKKQFGTGCEILFFDDENLEETLLSSIENVWRLAEQVRPMLLEAAKKQIEIGYEFYNRISELVPNAG